MWFLITESKCLYLWLFAVLRIGWAKDVPAVNDSEMTDIIRIQRLLPREGFSSKCAVPPQPMNGHWKLNRLFCDHDLDCDIPQGVELKSGNRLVYSCDAGYRVEGDTDVHCTTRGKWSDIPSCIPCNMTLYSPPRCLLWGQPVSRRDDYTYTPGIGGYKLHTRAETWNKAREICREEGGHLAIVNSMAEAHAIEELFKNSEPILGSPHPDFACIGFQDLYAEGQYVTIHDQSLASAGFTHWLDGQPDNAGGAENCGSFHRSGRLNDINCETKFGFICELPIYTK